jgi:hypothetical protein
MDATFELGGFFMAHAVWSICDSGEPLIPLIGFEGAGGRNLIRFAAEDLTIGVASGRRWIEENPDGAARAAFVFDGFATFEGVRKDALIMTIVEFGPPRRTLEVIVPYRPATAPDGFAVHRPKFTAADGFSGEDLAGAGDAFFRGVDAHEQAAAVWNAHLDQSF